VPKNSYWIADAEGNKALVEGAEARDVWTKVRGWSVTDEPGPTDQVHVVNANPEIGAGRMPYAAVELHAGLGWSAGPPPEPYDLTKDPVLVDQAPASAAAPVATKSPAAASATNVKE
jgi:hypothetical protein